ncbi:hypothetical protein [Burkholderia gladioli]|uniref:hypothetical protein n=1 Tax=Burkholderia gladioli TaxID=28095 RepID=UPI0016404EE7|nr:hypothetical protein [Burkholderia gladioli]
MKLRAPYRWPTPLEELSDAELRQLWIDLDTAIDAERRRRRAVREREFREFVDRVRQQGGAE